MTARTFALAFAFTAGCTGKTVDTADPVTVSGDCTEEGAVASITPDGHVTCVPTAFGQCPPGQVMTGIDDGSGGPLGVPVAASDGDIAGVTAGSGLTGGDPGDV